MAKSRASLDASTLFATKGSGAAVAKSQQRKPTEERQVDLNFKVPESFRKRFKIRAAQEGISGVELLRRIFDGEETDGKKI